MKFAAPIRLGLDEFGRDERAFDGASYLYVNEDVRAEIGFDIEGAWRHWTSVGHLQGRYPPGLGRTAPRQVNARELTSRPFGLNIFGPFAAISGLGTAARNLLAAIRAVGLPHDIHPYDVESGQARLSVEQLASPIRYRVNLVLANADQIRRLVGLYPDGTFDSAYTIAVWAWELAAFRADWQASFALVDEVWTNSQFELRSIASVSPVPVHLVPLPVFAAAEIERNAARAAYGLPSHAFIFLLAFDAGSTEQRKNPFVAIEAFHTAFGRDPSRVLVIKHHGASDDLSLRLLAARRGAANIYVIGARLSDKDHAALQSACDALVSPHRSEGFGLNLAEQLASGRAVIGTNYSGTCDFLDEDTGFPIAYRLVEVERRTGPYLQHAVWAEPGMTELVLSMRDVAAQAPRSCSRIDNGQQRMADAFSPAAIGAIIRQRLASLEQTHGAQDGLASTALASVALFVAPDGARADVAWPARLPTFSVITDRAPDAALRAQIYPFWEACIVGEHPPPDDADARSARRGDDLRAKLVDAVPGVPFAISASEAAAGAWIVLLPPGMSLAPDALLAVARAVDSNEPPDVVSFGATPLRPAPPFAVRKSLLLQVWQDRSASLDDVVRLLQRYARRMTHVISTSPVLLDEKAPDRHLAQELSISIRTISQNQAADPRALAQSICRGQSDEYLLLLDEREPRPVPATIDRLLGWFTDRQVGGVSRPGVFITRRSVLARVARSDRPVADLSTAVAALGLTVIQPDKPTRQHTLHRPLSLAEHADLIEQLGLFDRDHYLVSSPDVAISGTDPLGHYVEYGWREHRAPNFYFDPVWYRARYMREDEDTDPLLHYVHYRNSGVRPSRHFDPSWVRRSRQLSPDTDPLRYFLERRREEDISPLPEFDPAHYRARRRDIVYRKVDPFEHYMRFGAAEGVNPSAEFDTAFYAARHMAGVGRRDPVANNPLLHYLENRDRQPAITSLKAALRQDIARLRLLGRSYIEMSFCWFDGLPQRIDALRTYLSEPTLGMPFLLVFANGLLVSNAVETGDDRLLSALRLPLTDDYDDADICARLNECFLDTRCLRRDGQPLLAFVRGPDGANVDEFARRLAVRLQIDHRIDPRIEIFD